LAQTSQEFLISGIITIESGKTTQFAPASHFLFPGVSLFGAARSPAVRQS